MEKFISKLHYTISKGLPGETAHITMSPTGRGKSSDLVRQVKSFKESAVAIILFKEQDDYKSLLLQRQEYNGSHSGQICFPGGKQEQEDQDLLSTALRECEEETGIEQSKLSLLGELTPVFIPVSLHHVQPFLFYHEGIPTIEPDEYEVRDYFSFSLSDLIDESNRKHTTIPISSVKKLENVPYFHLNKKVVWGATAIMLNELKELIKRTHYF